MPWTPIMWIHGHSGDGRIGFLWPDRAFAVPLYYYPFFFSGLAPSWNYSHVKRYKSIVSIRVQIKTIGVNLFTRMHHWLAITTWGFVINSMLLVDAVREEDLCSDSVKGDIFSSSPIFFHSMSRHYRHKAIQYLIVLFCCGLIYSTVSTQPDPFLQQGCITSCKKIIFFSAKLRNKHDGPLNATVFTTHLPSPEQIFLHQLIYSIR